MIFIVQRGRKMILRLFACIFTEGSMHNFARTTISNLHPKFVYFIRFFFSLLFVRLMILFVTLHDSFAFTCFLTVSKTTYSVTY